jgi:DNA-binding transcriptional ArsR family regulator
LLSREPLTIEMVATLLGRSQRTARRHLDWLIEAGIAEVHEHGYVCAANAASALDMLAVRQGTAGAGEQARKQNDWGRHTRSVEKVRYARRNGTHSYGSTSRPHHIVSAETGEIIRSLGSRILDTSELGTGRVGPILVVLNRAADLDQILVGGTLTSFIRKTVRAPLRTTIGAPSSRLSVSSAQ